MIPLATIIARKLGKRMGKVATEAQEKSGHLNRYFVDLFKNHKIIKIFQRENYENIRSEDYVNALKDKSIKIRSVYLRSTPIMEVLTGFMIALLIFYSGHLIISGELNINNNSIIDIGNESLLLTNPISAIYTPFSIILYYEIFLLIY